MKRLVRWIFLPWTDDAGRKLRSANLGHSGMPRRRKHSRCSSDRNRVVIVGTEDIDELVRALMLTDRDASRISHDIFVCVGFAGGIYVDETGATF